MDQLIASNFWIKGPSWLSQEFDVNNITKKALENGLQEVINSEQISHSLVCLNTIQLDFKFSLYSKFDTILHIMSNILRFIYNCRHPYDKLTGPFSLHELQQAEMRIIYVEQHRAFADVIECLSSNRVIKDTVIGKLNPFLDNNGMLRISTGRCENNVTFSYDSKFPLLIPDGHISELFIRYMHLFLKHAGL